MKKVKLLLAAALALFAAGTLLESSVAEAAGSKRTVSSKSKTKVGVHKASIRSGSAKRVRAVYRRKAVKVLPDFADDGNPLLRSQAFVVQDQSTGAILLEKNGGAVLPIASITKLMTAMVVLDASPSLEDELVISRDDVDTLRGSSSRLAVGYRMSREDMLRLALMSSENRAASALARHYPGGTPAFVEAMNRKALELGLQDTRFFDSTGLNAGNVSSPRDLARMVAAAADYPLIREFSTGSEYSVRVNGRTRHFVNTNPLVRNSDWQIGVSKTGYIRESGKCLVMQAWFKERPLIIVLLDSVGRLTRVGDAMRIKKWLETTAAQEPGAVVRVSDGQG